MADLVGKVKDIAFAVGKTGISLSVENEAGENQHISWEDVQAASDFILLKPTKNSSSYNAEVDKFLGLTKHSSNLLKRSSKTVHSANLSNMRQTAYLDSTIQKMVLLQREKICLGVFSTYFFVLCCFAW